MMLDMLQWYMIMFIEFPSLEDDMFISKGYWRPFIHKFRLLLMVAFPTCDARKRLLPLSSSICRVCSSPTTQRCMSRVLSQRRTLKSDKLRYQGTSQSTRCSTFDVRGRTVCLIGSRLPINANTVSSTGDRHLTSKLLSNFAVANGYISYWLYWSWSKFGKSLDHN
jgi:hypothetical protein